MCYALRLSQPLACGTAAISLCGMLTCGAETDFERMASVPSPSAPTGSFPAAVPVPVSASSAPVPAAPIAPAGPDYAELHCHSNFSFLDGASHPEDMVRRAAELGYRGIAITDRDGLYAAVRLQETAREVGIQPVFGSEVTLTDGSVLTLLATDVQGYHNLSLLLTAGRRARPKGESAVTLEQVGQHAAGLICLSGGPFGAISQQLLRQEWEGAQQTAWTLMELFGAGNLFLELTEHLLPVELTLKQALISLARTLDLPIVATQDARYAVPKARRLHDVLTCIRHLTTVQEAGTRLMPNGEYFLQPRTELARRFRSLPESLRNTIHILERCQVTLNQLNFSLPEFPVPAPFRSMLEYLEHLTFLYAPARFPEVNARVVQQLRHELEVIGRHGLEGYFLIVWDIMKFCHVQGILAQGRGSAANSAVCFSLGITNVDPIHHQLLFERFLSEGRNEAPDIDLDIANDRREEVIQYVYQRYGRDHAGMVCEVICFRARSAIRDVGKALGLSLDQVDRIAKSIDRWGWSRPADSATPAPETSEEDSNSGSHTLIPEGADRESIPDESGGNSVPASQVHSAPSTAPSGAHSSVPSNAASLASSNATLTPTLQTTVGVNAPIPGAETAADGSAEDLQLSPEEVKISSLLWDLCQQIEGFPRHLGIHVGGMIICATPLGELVPIENATMADRTVVQWDKDDVGALKMPKIDLLGLGMLSLMGEALELIWVHEGKHVDPARLTYDDPRVYDMLCAADTVGVFQVESRAQMNVLPRLRPRKFYDLVVQVSLIRPGPIQGDMVHPYLRRRAGQEPVTYPHPSLQPILERTLGVPLFQEQGMKVAVTAADFTPSEADALRRAMGSKRSKGKMEELTYKLLSGMEKNGYDRAIAERVVNQIKAFASYGFPESHAASFGLLVYISAWLKYHHPLAFYVALLNNQPMGFYSPATIVGEMQRKGIEVLPVDVNWSAWEWTIQGKAVRAGLKSVRGLGDAHRESWEEARKQGPWQGVTDVCDRTGWPRLLLERMAAIGAFESLGLSRREALWQVQGYRPRPGLAAPAAEEESLSLRPMGVAESLVMDLKHAGHTTGSHPISLLRETLDRWKVLRSSELHRVRHKTVVRVAGAVTVRQRPPTAKGVCFLTLEDEGGMINVVVRAEKYEEYRPIVRRAILILIEGELERSRGVINIMADKIAALDDRWGQGLKSRDFH